jgi:hypothetical protein
MKIKIVFNSGTILNIFVPIFYVVIQFFNQEYKINQKLKKASIILCTFAFILRVVSLGFLIDAMHRIRK